MKNNTTYAAMLFIDKYYERRTNIIFSDCEYVFELIMPDQYESRCFIGIDLFNMHQIEADNRAASIKFEGRDGIKEGKMILFGDTLIIEYKGSYEDVRYEITNKDLVSNFKATAKRIYDEA